MSFGSGKIWMNGALVDWADAQIHIGSHVIHYGSGVFEGARCYDTPKGSACFRLDTHLRRLYDSAKVYRMAYDLDLPGLHDAVLDTIRANGYTACYIRPLLYRGYHELGVSPFECPVDAAILVWEWPAYLGEDALEQGVDVQVSSWARSAPNTFPAMAKSTANYANSQLIKMEATLNGYDEGIALESLTRVVELVQARAGGVLKVADLAAAAGCSEGQLERRMRKVFGLTATQYVLRVRVDRAAGLLVDTDRPIADIAVECGFSDQANLTRLFGRLIGETPARFRATRNA